MTFELGYIFIPQLCKARFGHLSIIKEVTLCPRFPDSLDTRGEVERKMRAIEQALREVYRQLAGERHLERLDEYWLIADERYRMLGCLVDLMEEERGKGGTLS